MIRRPPRSTLSSSSAASDVYKRQVGDQVEGTVAQLAANEDGQVILHVYHGSGLNSDAYAPILELSPSAQDQHPLISCELDVLCLVPKDTPLAALHAQVVAAMLLQLQVSAEMSPARTWHLHPVLSTHPITMVCPDGHSEQQAREHRTHTHIRLSLPLDRPLLHPRFALNSGAVQHAEKQGGIGGPRLSCTHVGLQPSGLEDGVEYLVDGEYDYYHYMQDGFDDNGWGCAYRSLQTIWSWFLKQGYVQRPVPTHREIQQALVEYQAKPAKHAGSKEWLGALEVASALDQLSDGEIVCNIEYVPEGADLEDKGNFLMKHFQTVGSPIMMGGGVLAFTMAGIDYNAELGQVRFLILDPHYTGKDVLKSIQPRWCGWKDIEFFDKFSFYNLCLPQRPTGQI
eukprot:TRINITY_DN28372_c0_g1_i2.p1 TRINITY_DN28372_c0_g1~~TRINITY_DN28372_c0_g1_i2.p1  ORF type:complete len:398 (+),score=71.03 TRINITY_DN28372_c0_g1_i2:151-1344(+)